MNTEDLAKRLTCGLGHVRLNYLCLTLADGIEAAAELRRLAEQVRVLREALTDVHAVLYRSASYAGYGIGPLQEPWTEHALRQAKAALAATETDHG